MKIETVIVLSRAVNCNRCNEPIIGIAKRLRLSIGTRVYCESCAEKGMENLESLAAKLSLPEAEFEAWLQE